MVALDRKIRLTNSKKVVSISVTGSWCALNCAHCGRHYLNHMNPVIQLESWYATGRRHFLISGGLDASGKIPLDGVIKTLKRFKDTHPNVHFNFHTGLVDDPLAQKIGKIADSVSFDFVGSEETIREVYGMDKTPNDFLESARLLRRYTRNLAIHITVGLMAGKLSHEESALDLIRDLPFEKLIFIIFIPTPGTRYEKAKPPRFEDVEFIFNKARKIFPDKHIALGCMQPRGNYRDRLQELAVSCGLDEIVNPTRKLRHFLEEKGIAYAERDACCAF